MAQAFTPLETSSNQDQTGRALRIRLNRSRLLGVVRKVTMRERLIRVRSESSFEQWTREAYEEIWQGFVKIYFCLFIWQFCLMRVLEAAFKVVGRAVDNLLPFDIILTDLPL